jgi:hypothetical protein
MSRSALSREANNPSCTLQEPALPVFAPAWFGAATGAAGVTAGGLGLDAGKAGAAGAAGVGTAGVSTAGVLAALPLAGGVPAADSPELSVDCSGAVRAEPLLRSMV